MMPMVTLMVKPLPMAECCTLPSYLSLQFFLYLSFFSTIFFTYLSHLGFCNYIFFASQLCASNYSFTIHCYLLNCAFFTDVAKHIANTKHKRITKKLRTLKKPHQPLLLLVFSFKTTRHFCMK